MADFSPAIAKTLAREGGARFTDNPDDRGGATKYGLSQRAYPNLDIRNLTEAQARDLYKRDYWDRLGGDQIADQSVAENLFDTGVNMGVRTACRLAQLCLNLPADGVCGAQTLQVLNAADPRLFLANYTVGKIARYAGICNQDKSQSKFLLGWLNRALGANA